MGCPGTHITATHEQAPARKPCWPALKPRSRTSSRTRSAVLDPQPSLISSPSRSPHPFGRDDNPFSVLVHLSDDGHQTTLPPRFQRSVNATLKRPRRRPRRTNWSRGPATPTSDQGITHNFSTMPWAMGDYRSPDVQNLGLPQVTTPGSHQSCDYFKGTVPSTAGHDGECNFMFTSQRPQALPTSRFTFTSQPSHHTRRCRPTPSRADILLNEALQKAPSSASPLECKLSCQAPQLPAVKSVSPLALPSPLLQDDAATLHDFLDSGHARECWCGRLKRDGTEVAKEQLNLPSPVSSQTPTPPVATTATLASPLRQLPSPPRSNPRAARVDINLQPPELSRTSSVSPSDSCYSLLSAPPSPAESGALEDIEGWLLLPLEGDSCPIRKPRNTPVMSPSASMLFAKYTQSRLLCAEKEPTQETVTGACSSRAAREYLLDCISSEPRRSGNVQSFLWERNDLDWPPLPQPANLATCNATSTTLDPFRFRRTSAERNRANEERKRRRLRMKRGAKRKVDRHSKGD